MYIVIFALATFAGGVVSSLIGWLNSDGAFNSRKFTASALTAFVTAIGGAGAASIISPDSSAQWVLLLFGAFATGAGVDALRHHVGGATKRK